MFVPFPLNPGHFTITCSMILLQIAKSESWDSSYEKSCVPVQNKCVPVQKTLSPYLYINRCHNSHETRLSRVICRTLSIAKCLSLQYIIVSVLKSNYSLSSEKQKTLTLSLLEPLLDFLLFEVIPSGSPRKTYLLCPGIGAKHFWVSFSNFILTLTSP